MAKKVTKKETLLAMIEKYSMSADDAAFIQHEVELLDKRYEHKSDKPTKKQVENATLKDCIVGLIEEGKIYTATDLAGLLGNDAEGKPYSAQKVSALLKQIVETGAVVRGEIKRRTYFGLPGTEFVEPPKAEETAE